MIATHNRCATLAQTLERLYDLPEHPRIVVVDNASVDDTDRACKRFANRILFLKLRRNLGAAARTIGAREAATPYIAFCDDDCYWTPGSLQCAVERLHNNPQVGVINGQVLIGESQSPDPACQAMQASATAADCPGIPIAYFMAGASVMRTRAFLEAGGYHERYFIGAEESLLSLDLASHGWGLWYCGDVVVRHQPSPVNRDPDARRRLVLRNRLWTTLLRRSPITVLRTLGRYVQLAAGDPIVRAALVQALAGLPWIVRERRRIPGELEERIAAFDNAFGP